MTQKRTAIVQCCLGDMGKPPSRKNSCRPYDALFIQLRVPPAINGAQRTERRSSADLVLDVRDGDLATLRTTLLRLSERYAIRALLPPINAGAAGLQVGAAVAQLAAEWGLPGASPAAYATSLNRYLSRCQWQKKDLPTTPFSLIQFPSALAPAIATVGLPSRLSPLHYGLPHLSAHISQESEGQRAYHLVSHTLQRQALVQPLPVANDGVDPRTQHHFRFSFTSDVLATADPGGLPVEATVLIHCGQAQILSCTPIIRRQRGPKSAQFPALSRDRIMEIAQVAMDGCAAIDIDTGIVTCRLHTTPTGIFLDGVIPNVIDERLIPGIEAVHKQRWDEIILDLHLQS